MAALSQDQEFGADEVRISARITVAPPPRDREQEALQRNVPGDPLESEPVPYCPECLTEYVEGAVECMDCRVALLPGLPPRRVPGPERPDDKLARVRTFS